MMMQNWILDLYFCFFLKLHYFSMDSSTHFNGHLSHSNSKTFLFPIINKLTEIISFFLLFAFCRCTNWRVEIQTKEIWAWNVNAWARFSFSFVFLGNISIFFIVNTFFCMLHNQIFRIKKMFLFATCFFPFLNFSRLPAAISMMLFFFYFSFVKLKKNSERENEIEKKVFFSWHIQLQMKPFHGSFYIHFSNDDDYLPFLLLMRSNSLL